MSEQLVRRNGRFWIDEQGILHGVAAPGSSQTLADAEEQLAAQRRMAGGRPRPFLMDMRGTRALPRDVRQLYASAEAAELFSAAALVVGSPLSRAIGNFFLGLNRPPMPTRLFDSESEALGWLRTFLPAAEG
jgi:hypothetical protein